MVWKDACLANPILRAAGPAARSALIGCGRFRDLDRGEHLFLERMSVPCVYFLDQGAVALYRLGPNQEKKVIFICAPGEMLNEVAVQEAVSSASCEALSCARVLQFPAEEFCRLLGEDPALSRAVMDAMARTIRRLYRQMRNTCNTVRLDRQLASKLWKLARLHGQPCKDGVEIGFDLSVTYLADLLGSKRETVSRQVKVLTGRGLIAQRRGRFVVLDPEGLQNYYREP